MNRNQAKALMAVAMAGDDGLRVTAWTNALRWLVANGYATKVEDGTWRNLGVVTPAYRLHSTGKTD